MDRDPLLLPLLDAIPVRLWATDTAARSIYFNEAWRDFLGPHHQPGARLCPGFDLHPDEADTVSAHLCHHFATRQPISLEFRLRRADGAWRWMLCSGRARTNPAGGLAGFIGSCTDITERHEAQAVRERELAEKIVLTQELHHRVKNSAQVFTSLLRVQANRAHDPAAKVALAAAAARSSAMASTHQQIWDAGTSSRFDLVAAIHRRLRAHRSDTVTVTVDATAPLLVPLGAAIPIALILHELLDNAVRHAFPAGAPGHVTIAARQGQDATVTLSVADDGSGMLPTQKDGVGLTIARSLARQIGGQLALHVGPGTTATLALPCPPA